MIIPQCMENINHKLIERSQIFSQEKIYSHSIVDGGLEVMS